MTQKNHQEQKASDKQVEMISQALEKATQNNGIFLCRRRPQPSLSPRDKGASGFNDLFWGFCG
jgi:hypothetical protein